MTRLESINYYRSREQRERELADIAASPEISAIHLAMAARYAELIPVPGRPDAVQANS